MRYRLRTLMIATTIGPPALAAAWFTLPFSLAVAGWIAIASLPIGAIYFWWGWRTLVRRAADNRAHSNGINLP